MYIAESFLRAYDTLWKPLDEVTKQRYLKEFAKLRHIDPPFWTDAAQPWTQGEGMEQSAVP